MTRSRNRPPHCARPPESSSPVGVTPAIDNGIPYLGTAAIGGVVPTITGVVEGINESPYAGNIVAFFQGSLNQYPEAYKVLIDNPKTEGPQNKTGFLKVREHSVLENFAYYAGQDIFGYFKQGAAIATEKEIVDVRVAIVDLPDGF
ncbi:hypothetical protein B0T16DRAFT_421080 [Cercophora newfieldiana]|uniref:Uncharacterized protein n=1 Tax=Cercophora newfieldiana TaxID=92897 RepID=A0AA39XXN0_9PEZI|nr:hypothetical protein B0T16DRAFT_421080 [Cercophora newfieldiana]